MMEKLHQTGKPSPMPFFSLTDPSCCTLYVLPSQDRYRVTSLLPFVDIIKVLSQYMYRDPL